MPPENLRFGGGASETILHPVVLVAMLLAIALIFLLPRRYVIVPVLASFFLIPLGQAVVLGGLHFFVHRIIILAVASRMLVAAFSSPESIFGGPLDILDKAFLLWAIFRAAAGILLFMQPAAVINQFGFLLDAIGGYFVLRYLIHDEEDIRHTLQTFAVLSSVIACFMLYEKIADVNVFGLLGGVRSDPEVRTGSIRSQGPFQHALLAGTFGATLIPLFVLLWSWGKSKGFAALGFLSATIITATSACSTPLFAYLAAVGAILAWPLRKRMRLVRWGIVGMLVALQMVMKAPVWFLIQRVDLIAGSSGYHRAMLVNDFIMNFRDWWLIGTKENAAWGFNMWDLCNQYVAEGQVGGLATFICFIALICLCFSKLGRARKAVEGDRSKEWFFWLLGAALFSHVMAYFGISYFDQTRDAWFALLGIILVATAPYLVRSTVPERAKSFRYPRPQLVYRPLSSSSLKTTKMVPHRGSQLS